MNEQLPPVERSLADQLARRSAGRPPAGLLDEVLSAVDSAPSAPVVRFAGFSPRTRVSGALVGLAAAVALVAALVAVPALRNAPPAATSVPTDRPLSTAELAILMSGPALPTNTALVAQVTIQSKSDVCPMNRYPTLGVIEGMSRQVCVMTSTVPVAIAESGEGSGVFAFRYLGPGVLGLLGKVTMPSSGLAYKVADQWPLQGQTFVVDGWLGSSAPEGLAVSCASMAPAGDVLSPNGTADCPPTQDWLADNATPAALESPNAYVLARQSIDPSALFGNARLVEAYGARQIDAIDERNPQAGAVHGRYVVRAQTGACPGASAVSSVGCTHWLVLAKLADNLQSTQATPKPAPSESGLAGYPLQRPLTTSELGRMLAGLDVYNAVVANVTLEAGTDCPMVDSAFPMNLAGKIAGIQPNACVYASTAGGAKAGASGKFAFRKLGDGILGLLGEISPAGSRLAFEASETWPENGTTFLMRGYLGATIFSCPTVVPAPTPDNPLDPRATELCSNDYISSSGQKQDGHYVDAAAARTYDGVSANPTLGVYVVRSTRTGSEQVGPGQVHPWKVLARLADVTLPVPVVTKPPATPEAPATPVPEPSTDPAVQGSYPNDRALTANELAAYLKDGLDIKGQTVVADVRFSQTNGCPGYPGYEPIGLLGNEGLQDVCVVGTRKVMPNDRGVFAFRVFDSRTLGFIDNVMIPGDGPLSLGNEDWPKDQPLLVHGALFSSTSRFDCQLMTAKAEPLDPSPIECGKWWIAPEATSGGEIDDQQAAAAGYPEAFLPWMGSEDQHLLPSTGESVYLIRWLCASRCAWEVMARVDRISAPAQPAPTTAGPTSAAKPSAGPSAGAVVPTDVVAAPNGGPLPLAQLYAAWKSNPSSVGDHIVIVKGLLPASMACLTADGLSLCDYAIAGEGYWVVRIDTSGTITLLGEAKQPPNGIGAFSSDQLVAAKGLAGGYVVIEGSLTGDLGGYCDLASAVRPFCYTATYASTGSAKKATVHFASEEMVPSGSSTVSGRFLVKVTDPTGSNITYTVVGRLPPNQ